MRGSTCLARCEVWFGRALAGVLVRPRCNQVEGGAFRRFAAGCALRREHKVGGDSQA